MKRSLFEGYALTALHEILSGHPGARHEHSARHYVNGHERDRQCWAELGFKTVHEVSRQALFLQHRDDDGWRLEIVPAIVPLHEAWAVASEDEFERLAGAFTKSGTFEELEEMKVETADTFARMFRYNCALTGDEPDERPVVQVVFRKRHIFSGVFDG